MKCDFERRADEIDVRLACCRGSSTKKAARTYDGRADFEGDNGSKYYHEKIKRYFENVLLKRFLED